jgi:DNA-binding NarL/FixJ family response regulator
LIEIAQHVGAVAGGQVIGASIGQMTVQRNAIIQTFQHIHVRALTAEQTAKRAADLELELLAQGVRGLAQRLAAQAAPSPSRVIGEATNGHQAVALARESCPDVAVLDISMPDLDGLQAAGLIRAGCPRTQVLILTMHESDAYFFRAVEAGAAGYLLKKAASENLVSAVRAVAQGEAFFYPSMARKLLEGYLKHDNMPRSSGRRSALSADPSGYDELSDREREVMFLLVRGLSNQEIAEKLVVSPSTAQTHRAHILRKLGLETTIDLVRYAIRHGLIEA